MRQMTSWRFIIISLTALVLASPVGCMLQKKAEIRRPEVRTLYSSATCDSRTDRAAASWLDSPSSLAAAYQRLTQSRLNPAPPPVNFDTSGVLLIEMGRRNTGGYRLSLVDPQLSVSEGQAQVHIAWSEPRPGAMVTQVITSPCLLLEIPRGGFSSIQVVDQAGRVRAAVNVGRGK